MRRVPRRNAPTSRITRRARGRPCRLSSVGQSDALVMRRSRVRLPQADSVLRPRRPENGPSSNSTDSSVRDLSRSTAPILPPTSSAPRHRLASMTCPYRSRVMLAVACPSTRCTTFASAPAPNQIDAALCRRSCTRRFGQPIACFACGHPTARFQFSSRRGVPADVSNNHASGFAPRNGRSQRPPVSVEAARCGRGGSWPSR